MNNSNVPSGYWNRGLPVSSAVPQPIVPLRAPQLYICLWIDPWLWCMSLVSICYFYILPWTYLWSWYPSYLYLYPSHLSLILPVILISVLGLTLSLISVFGLICDLEISPWSYSDLEICYWSYLWTRYLFLVLPVTLISVLGLTLTLISLLGLICEIEIYLSTFPLTPSITFRKWGNFFSQFSHRHYVTKLRWRRIKSLTLNHKLSLQTCIKFSNHLHQWLNQHGLCALAIQGRRSL